jgi:hypothetical protein
MTSLSSIPSDDSYLSRCLSGYARERSREQHRQAPTREAPIRPDYDNPDWDPEDKTRHFFYSGEKHLVQFIKKGTAHATYSFAESKTQFLQIQDTVIELAKNIIRTPIGDTPMQAGKASSLSSKRKGLSRKEEVLEQDFAALQHLQAYHVPHPLVRVMHHNCVDPTDPKSGGYWVVERCVREVSTLGWDQGQSMNTLSEEDRQALEFAKRWIQEMISKKKDIINDFKPENVMWNEKGELCVVDFSVPAPDSEDVKANLEQYIEKWACGNAEVEAFLRAEH